MDNDEQIKEMKSDFVAIMGDCYGDKSEITDSFVEGVHNIGYRKIPVGSIILSKEEYDNLVKFNDIKPDLLARQLGFNDGCKVGALQILTGVYFLLELIKDKEDTKVLLKHIEMWEEEFGVKVDR